MDLDNHYRTPLHYAAEKGDITKCRELVADKGDTLALDAADDCGMTALHLAAKYNHPAVVQFLLKECNLDVNVECTRQPYLGHTPLHFAAQVVGGDMVCMLLRLGADANATARDGDTALHVAARFGDDAVIDELVRGGALVDTQNDSGLTSLMVASGLGRRRLVTALLRSGASVHLVDSSGNTALHHGLQCPLQALFGGNYPVDNDHYNVGYALIRSGCDVDAENENGNKALDFCTSATKTILLMAGQLPFENFEQVLNVTQSKLKSRGIKGDDAAVVMEALHKFHSEIKEMEEEQKNAGGCPVLNARRRKQEQTTEGGECPIPFHRQLSLVMQHPFLTAAILASVSFAAYRLIRRG